MPDDAGTRTVTVTLELDAALVQAAEATGQPLSFTVQRALHRSVQPRRMTDDEVARYVEAANERYERHGSAADGHFPG